MGVIVGADSDPYRAARFLMDSYPALSNPPLTIADGKPRRPLALCEFRVRSQNGEDGVIAEIVSRIGTDRDRPASHPLNEEDNPKRIAANLTVRDTPRDQKSSVYLYRIFSQPRRAST